MNYGAHKIAGAISSLGVGAYLYSEQTSMLTIAISAISTYIFSLYPDTDIKSSSSKTIYMLGLPFVIYLFAVNHLVLAFLLCLTLAIPLFSDHRGFTHTLVSLILNSVIWGYIINVTNPNIPFNVIVFSSAIGYITHLILDRHIKII